MGILGELWVKLGLKNDDLKKGLNDSKKEVSGFASSIKKLGGMLASAFAVEKVIAFTHQTAELANKAAGVKKAFDRLNSPGLLSDLRRATMGTVDDLQLMQRAVQANNFKIPLNQLATYLEFATKRANETGESVDYLVNSIITGLGRQSVMILDNLGISAAEIRDRMKEGGTMADAVGKIIKEQMGEGAAEIDKATLATEKFTAAWANFSMAFGQGTAPAWNWLKEQASSVLNHYTKILNSKNLTAFGKLYSFFNPINPMAEAALAKDIEDAPIGPEPKTAEMIKAEEAAAKAAEAEAKKRAAEEAKRRSQIITYLKEQIALKEQERDLSANVDEIKDLNDKIAKMKEELKVLQMTREEYQKYRNEQMQPIPEVNNPLGSMFDKDYIAERGKAAMDAINAHYQQYTDALAAQREKAVEQQQMLDQMNEHFNSSIVAGISGGVDQLVRAMMGVEDANLGTVVQALLTPMADALASAGEMIIAEGIAVEAFKDSLKNLNGMVAIAAGSALVAVAGAVKAGLQSIGSNPTRGGGYAGSVTSYSGGYGVNTANYSQPAYDYSLVTTLKGQDIYLALQRTEQNNKR